MARSSLRSMKLATSKSLLELVGNTPTEFASIVRAELPGWGKIIREAGIKLTE